MACGVAWLEFGEDVADAVPGLEPHAASPIASTTRAAPTMPQRRWELGAKPEPSARGQRPRITTAPATLSWLGASNDPKTNAARIFFAVSFR